MKHLHLLLPITLAFSLCGCATTSQTTGEAQAHQVAAWVQENSGLIENAVAYVVQYEVSKAPQGTDREKIINQINIASKNLSALLSAGNFDADSVRKALKINEVYVTPSMEAVAVIISTGLADFKKNGYADASLEVLNAVLKGIEDGTKQ